MRPFLVLFLFVIILTSCQKDIVSADSKTLPAQTLSNIAYGADAAQGMDIYLPVGRTDSATKAIIMVHGGAWATGDKTDFTSDIDTLKKRLPGYAIFNINYRLAVNGTNTFPTQENDVKAAVGFVFSKAAEYKFNKNKLVILGVSAGAHLALLQAYKYNTPVFRAVIDFFGPTDMTDMYTNPMNALVPNILQGIVGATPTSNPQLYAQSSPLSFVSAQSPPTLILHGALDDLVNVQESITLKNRLTALGVPAQLFIYPTEGHGWYGANLSDSYSKVEAFLKTYLP